MKKKKEENPREEWLKESTKALKYLGFEGKIEEDGFEFDPKAPMYVDPVQGNIKTSLVAPEKNLISYINREFGYASNTYVSDGSEMVFIEQDEKIIDKKYGEDTSHNIISLPRAMIPDLIELLEKFKDEKPLGLEDGYMGKKESP